MFGINFRFDSNRDLIKHIINTGYLKSQLLIESFYKIDRIDFVLKEHKDVAYLDKPLSIGYKATISQPSTVAFMLELLRPQKGDKILDIGSGSCWTTAILANTVGKKGDVIGIDIIKKLVDFGNNNLKKYDLANTKNILVNSLGYSKNAPYDKILVSASAKNLPEILTSQLNLGGRMVIPIKNSVWLIKKTNKNEIISKEHFGFVFVPLIYK